jgi:hypothetical protein
LFGHDAHSKKTTGLTSGGRRAGLRNKDGLIGAIYTTLMQSGSVEELKAGNTLSGTVANC